MEALQYTSYGGGVAGLKHVKVPIPEPKQDELLVRVEAVSLNPFDWKIQKGMLRPIMPSKFPHIPCTDVAGEVVKVGSATKGFKPGDKVVAMLSPLNGGGLAEYAAVKANTTVHRPDEVPAAEASVLATTGMTAYQALRRVGGLTSRPIRNILITAASGGVGIMAVQLAKLLAPNSHLTVTCGARNFEFMRSLGADELLDYRTPEGASLKSPSGKKYDLIIDAASGIPWSTFAPNMSEDSKVVYLTPNLNSLLSVIIRKLTFSKKKAALLFTSQNKEDLDFLVHLVKEGKLKVKIDSKYPLTKADDAWAKCIDGHATGKIIVEPWN
ncbi:OLC1v1006691C3 [Oldenlandia corymbosa var. corymbosa]|uniref:OLC1v1006691C3 n=1 Tax=Oldenlandia corymbosa var. corymbosa TaxID=529605 RepID=A0AAV1DI89_OLDCO|nr:OLC1v1006691C3 [Oldenlandia corymbosa var. corymbosa]